MAEPGPVDEFDPQLVGGVGLADEFVLVEPEHPVEHEDLRDRRLAHADGADHLAFDQFDAETGHRAQHLGQRGSGHPARRAAAHDHDLAQGFAAHRPSAIKGAASDQAPARRRNSSCVGSWQRRADCPRAIAAWPLTPALHRANRQSDRRRPGHILPQHHRHPAGHIEQLRPFAENPRVQPPHLQLARQAFGHLHVADIAPELRVVALGGLVMQDDEIAHVIEQLAHAAVVLVALQRADRLAGKQREQPRDAVLDQVDAGRFERLHEARRKPDGDDIVDPALFAAARWRSASARFGQRLAVEIGQQDRLRLVLLHEVGCNRRGRCRCGAAAGCATASLRRARWSG